MSSKWMCFPILTDREVFCSYHINSSETQVRGKITAATRKGGRIVENNHTFYAAPFIHTQSDTILQHKASFWFPVWIFRIIRLPQELLGEKRMRKRGETLRSKPWFKPAKWENPRSSTSAIIFRPLLSSFISWPEFPVLVHLHPASNPQVYRCLRREEIKDNLASRK